MDAKSLLRAKKQEVRIDHPYASYTSAGQLRCTVCAQSVVKWDAHILTKQHRQSVQREKEAQAKAEADAAAKAKRKLAATEAKQPSAGGQVEGNEAKRAKVDAGRGLPEGFFSAGNRPVVGDDDDEEDEEVAGGDHATPGPSNVPAAPTGATGDAELDDFFASLAEDNAPAPPAPTSAPAPAASRRQAYKEVIPGVASYEAAPVRNVEGNRGGEGQDGGEEQDVGEEEESEVEKKARLEREEREEIMDRLDEEERAQEDADSRVSALKKRMELLRKQRQARTKA